MDIEVPELISSLAPTFEAARTHLSRLSREAAQLHEVIQVQDEKSRAVFNSLSRILAMSDQIELVLSLMREDVRVIDEIAPESGDVLWTEQFGDSFEQWLRASLTGALKIN